MVTVWQRRKENPGLLWLSPVPFYMCSYREPLQYTKEISHFLKNYGLKSIKELMSKHPKQ
jgi:hypothetical protein